MASPRSVVGTFTFDGDEPQTVLTEITGTVSESLVGFRQQCMEHLSEYMKLKGDAVNATEVHAFDDNEDVEVEEDNVDMILKGKAGSKKQKT